jgi:uncharacterized protein YggE
MAAKKRARAGDSPPARPGTESSAKPAVEHSGPETLSQNTLSKNTSKPEDTKTMPSQGMRTETPMEGVTVIGEAVRRVLPERAEFVIEIAATAMTAAQALRDNQAKTMQVSQTVHALGVQPADIQTISLKVHSLSSPVMQSLPGYAGMPQIGPGGFSPFNTGGSAVQPDAQFGSYHAVNILRVNVREPGRAGELADAAARAGATITGAFCFRTADEASARRAALEAAGHDARKKAEVLATAAGKKVGDAIAISEDIVASNGIYTALRATMPFAFGAGAQEVAGELEYYARVSANFRFQ